MQEGILDGPRKRNLVRGESVQQNQAIFAFRVLVASLYLASSAGSSMSDDARRRMSTPDPGVASVQSQAKTRLCAYSS